MRRPSYRLLFDWSLFERALREAAGRRRWSEEQIAAALQRDRICSIEVDDIGAWLHKADVAPSAYVVVVTRGHTHDFEAIRALAVCGLVLLIGGVFVWVFRTLPRMSPMSPEEAFAYATGIGIGILLIVAPSVVHLVRRAKTR